MNSTTIKALICDDSASYGIKLASELSKRNIYAYTRHGNESTITNSILNDRPDVVILDLTLENTDAAIIMQKVRSLLSEQPAFIVLSEVDNSFIQKQIISLGAAYYYVKPADADQIAEIVHSVVAVPPSPDCHNANLLVTELIRRTGIPAHVKGYRYIRVCILECLRDKTLLDNITKRLYPIVSEKYATTPVRVERAIRHAIEIAWDRSGSDSFSASLGYASSPLNARPSNAEFIAMATDKIYIQLLSYDKHGSSRHSERTAYRPFFNSYSLES